MQQLKGLFKGLTDGFRTKSEILLPTPGEVRKKYPVDSVLGEQILGFRQTVKDIIDGKDNRFLAVIGPCSVHNEEAALRFVAKVKPLADKVKDKIFIVIRFCFEKPRTEDGWEGYANDCDGDGHCRLGKSLSQSRRLLWKAAQMGLPIASEALDQNSEQYLSDLLCMAWLGARTVEATTLRRMASAMSMPVGIKNATSGDVTSAINAMVYASKSGRTFPGANLLGQLVEIHASGNSDTFLILRGGKRPDYQNREISKLVGLLKDEQVDESVIESCRQILSAPIRPNYTAEEVGEALNSLKKASLPLRVVIDCSHGNSEKDYQKQVVVWNDIIKQRLAGNQSIVGALLESYLKSGNQKHERGKDFSGLDPEVSITDACLGWNETENLILETHGKLV